MIATQRYGRNQKKRVRLTKNKKHRCVSANVTIGIVTNALFGISLYPELGYNYSFLDYSFNALLGAVHGREYS